MEQKKLTDRDPLLASAASANLIFYVVDGDDTTQDPEGSSFQISREQLLLALGLETSSGNQLLRGNYFPLPDSYDYFVWADRYKFNGIITNNYISDTLSLDAAHATLDRFDVLVLNNDHTFSVVKGTASANPAVPGINTETQISMAIIRVTADTTAPPEITSISAYKENAQTGGGEFDTATSGAAVILDSTEQASAGTKSIKFNSSISGDKATLTDDSSHNGSALTLLKLDVYITAVANYKLNITLNAADDNASAVVEIQDGLFGFNKNSLNEWQTVIIPAGSIPGIAAFNYNELVIENKQNNTTFYIDEVILQEGGSAISPTANYTLNLSGTNLQLLKDGVVHSVADLSGLVAAESLPPGGTTGQILKKQSNDDGDAYWEDEAAAPDLSGYQLKPAEGAFVDGDKTKLDALTNAEPPIDETYANITALIAAQNDQLEDWLYKVTDASDHTDVTTGSATFRYLGTTLGTVSDYELEWKEEDKVLTNAEVETAYNSQVSQVSGGEITAGTETEVRRFAPADVKAMVDEHASGGSGLPSPYLFKVTPLSLTPSTTANVNIYADYITSTTTVAIESQTVNSVTYKFDANNVPYLQVSVTTGTTEAEYDVTLNNGAEAVFVDAFEVNLGEIFEPSSEDWEGITGNVNVEETGEVKLTGLNVIGSARWNKQIDYTKDWRVRFKIRTSGLGVGNTNDFDNILRLVKHSDNSNVQYFNLGNGGSNGRILCRQNNNGTNIEIYQVNNDYGDSAAAMALDTWSWRHISGVLYLYRNETLEYTYGGSLTENLKVEITVDQFEFFEIKYIELP